MSLQDLSRRHLSLIGVYSTRYAIRGGAGLIFLLLVLTVGLLVGHIIVDMTVGQIRAQLIQQGESVERTQEFLDMVVEKAVPYVSWAIGEREDAPIMDEDDGRIQDKWASYLLLDQPALLSVVLLILVYLLPFMSVTASFNQYSGDVSTRGIRYQLLRTERANIYFGRYIGTILYAALTLALLMGTIVVYMGLKLDLYSWGALIGWGLRGWFSLCVLLIPYTALCGMISGAIDSPFGSLVLCILAVVGVPLVALVAGLSLEEAKYVKWLLPWAIQNDLLHYQAWRAALAILACLGYAAVFLSLGYLHFSKRDL